MINFYKKLVDRFVKNEASEEELEVFDYLLREGELDEALESHMKDSWSEELAAFEQSQEKSSSRGYLWKWSAGLAASILIVAFGYFFLKNRTSSNDLPLAHQIVPGSNKAILVLASGKRINLTDAPNRTVAAFQGLNIVKDKNGNLIYDLLADGMQSSSQQNTIQTPRGGQYIVKLADGTIVTLNAESTLRFPAVFQGQERKVQLIGEGYFEVTKNKKKPFVIEAGGQKVTVLGTHFNVSAYPESRTVRTTLVEGKVRVNDKVTLVPGQQAIAFGNQTSVRAVDTEEATAWKDGAFIFGEDNFESAMDMIARWYDIDFIYEYRPAALHIGGKISRGRSIEEILNFISEASNNTINFKIEGRRVRVSK